MSHNSKRDALASRGNDINKTLAGNSRMVQEKLGSPKMAMHKKAEPCGLLKA